MAKVAMRSHQTPSGAIGVHIRESITIDAPVEEIYRYWRELDRLPQLVPYLESVIELDSQRSLWIATAIDAVPVSWEAEIVRDVPFETIAWKTPFRETIQHAGAVTFKPAFGDRGTEVRVQLQYAATGRRAARWLHWLAGEQPAQRLLEGLQSLKRRLEDGLTEDASIESYQPPSPPMR